MSGALADMFQHQFSDNNWCPQIQFSSDSTYLGWAQMPWVKTKVHCRIVPTHQTPAIKPPALLFTQLHLWCFPQPPEVWSFFLKHFICCFIYLLLGPPVWYAGPGQRTSFLHELFRSVLFKFQIFGNFSSIFLVLVYNLISLWSEVILRVISILLNLLRLKSILSEIDIDTLVFLWLVFSWYIYISLCFLIFFNSKSVLYWGVAG